MIKFTDKSNIGGTKKTQEGYLVATSRVARVGVQEYLASEIGDVAIAAGFSGDDVVRVYRGADQVFHKDTLASITRIPVTVDHPAEMVNADNYVKYAVGDVGDAYKQDGDWIVVNPMIKDAAAVKAAETSHAEISMGYLAEIVKARDGVDADFEMVNIRMNHLALVPKGRAGSQARIGDAANWGAMPINLTDQKEPKLDMIKIMVGDKAVQVAANDADTITSLVKDHKTAIDAKDASIGELKAKLAEAESKVLDDAAVTALVDAKVKSQSMREAVKAKFGDEAIKDASDAEIAGMFRVIDKALVDDSARDAIKGKQAKSGTAWEDFYAKKEAKMKGDK